MNLKLHSADATAIACAVPDTVAEDADSPKSGNRRPLGFARWMTLGFYSPGGFLIRAAILVLLFLIGHFAGWREAASVISGTLPDGARGMFAGLRGAYYLVTYFCAVLIAPTLLTTSIILLLLRGFLSKKNSPQAGSVKRLRSLL